jgi:hypothetical protein
MRAGGDAATDDWAMDYRGVSTGDGNGEERLAVIGDD